MLKRIDFSGRPFHFIGIGGIGMSALAFILAERQLPVSGSDVRSSPITERLQATGVKIFYGQSAANIALSQIPTVDSQALHLDHQSLRVTQETSVYSAAASSNSEPTVLPQVICSTAISESNPEYRAAIELGCPIFHRSDVLAALIQEYRGIAVAGTHGKTTTSSLISHLLYQLRLDPTVIIGGEVGSLGGNARTGEGPYLVAEADESDGSLVKHIPWVGVITNIELDHPDHYDDLEQVVEIFQTFGQNCQVLIGCIDCPTVRNRLRLDISYSLQASTGADYAADSIIYHARGITAQIWERGIALGEIEIPLLGEHNLKNALAAIAVCRYVGLDFAMIAQAMLSFEGARRRFEIRGEQGGIRFVDDYAHHPSEIQATLAAARLQMDSIAPTAPQHRVIAIFQPHRFSRTEVFLSEFATSFVDADLVVVSDIYSAGEPDLGRIQGQQVADAISAHHRHVYYQPSLQSVAAFLKETLQPGDTALFLGAGNLNQTIPDVMGFYQHHMADMSQSLS